MNRIERLEKELKNSDPESIERIHIINDLIFEILVPDPKRCEELAQESLRISEKLQYELGITYDVRNRALLCYVNADLAGSRENMAAALEKFKIAEKAFRKRAWQPYSILIFSGGSSRVKMSSGLLTAHHIIQQHKGRIDVRSEVDKGSAFTISLPRHLTEPQAN